MKINNDVTIIGAGPAGLMAAEVLSNAGRRVAVYDAMPSVGRKLLMAGKGGLNISHSEDFEQFVSHYGARQPQLEPLLREFSPDDLRAWLSELGINTFIGTSGRVFPLEGKAAPFLRAWLHRLRAAGVSFHTRHRWLGWRDDGSLRFEHSAGECSVHTDALVLALGGGSWAKLGSTGAWVKFLQQRGIAIAPLKPSNCGFELAWREQFKSSCAGQPLKNVRLRFADFNQQGELMITEQGLEGGLIYAASALLRDSIERTGHAVIELDLLPEVSATQLHSKLSAPRGKQSLSNFLRKRGIAPVKINLLREVLSPEQFNDMAQLITALKALPLILSCCRPLDEAISSAGGVPFEVLNEALMLRDLPSVFCAGEMLDWEAPTGGYLLTACFASGRAAGLGALAWLQTQQ